MAVCTPQFNPCRLSRRLSKSLAAMGAELFYGSNRAKMDPLSVLVLLSLALVPALASIDRASLLTTAPKIHMYLLFFIPFFPSFFFFLFFFLLFGGIDSAALPFYPPPPDLVVAQCPSNDVGLP